MIELEAWQLIRRAASVAATWMGGGWNARIKRERLEHHMTTITFALADIPYRHWEGLVEPLQAAGSGLELLANGLRVGPPRANLDASQLVAALKNLARTADAKAAHLEARSQTKEG